MKKTFRNIVYSVLPILSLTFALMIAAGKADASATLSASNIVPIDNGLNITFIAGLHTGCTKYMTKKDSPIKKLSDLKVEGDPVRNGKILSLLNYNPGVKDAKKTVENIVFELKGIGLLKETTDPAKLAAEHFSVLEGVPESFILNDDGSFTEVWGESLLENVQQNKADVKDIGLSDAKDSCCM